MLQGFLSFFEKKNYGYQIKENILNFQGVEREKKISN